MKGFFLFIILSSSILSQTFAQENTEILCNNGIDDDGNGFVDCYDKGCYNAKICDNFFIGKDAACNVKPDSFPPFEMKIKFTSPPNTTNHVNRLIVGDVDKDGIPEIVTTYRNADNSGNGTTISTIDVLQAPVSGAILNIDNQIDLFKDGFNVTFEDIAMADIDKDGCAEFFILTSAADGQGYRIIAYNCKGVKIWNAPIDFGTMPGYNITTYPGTMGLVDFDGDGKVELYVRAQIFDAHTGTFMGEYNVDNDETNAPHAGVNKGWGMTTSAPTAADIDPTSPGLELIAGCRIYGVQINRGSMTATISKIKELPQYATRTQRVSGNHTSVADFNQDGFLDVLAVGSLNAYDDNTTIFFWDVKNNGLKTYQAPGGGWGNGAGRINIADIDGDTLMNAVYVSGSTLYALKETPTALDILWTQAVTENTSGYTGCTMFDFNADGKSEIVYRDEDYIYIYTTTNIAGVVTVTRSTGITCKSRTSNEYPIVADMDGDGSTEICVTCAVDETVLGRFHSLFDAAEVRIYQSANVPWVPARRVWNQHGYFIVNVNDDLTIPTHQQQSEKVFANHAPCKLGGRNRPFNSFLNQAPFTNSFGCPQYAAPNLTPIASSLTINQPTCPDKDFTISFQIQNTGNMAVSGNLPISFYDHNPFKAGAKKFNTVSVILPKLGPNDIFAITNATVHSNGSADSLFIVINDSGIPGTSPIKLPNTPIIECDYDNEFSTLIKPKPVSLTTGSKDNIKCFGSISPDNGATNAFIAMSGGVQNTIDYNFYWSKGMVAKPLPADHIGSSYTGLHDSTYTVYAFHKTANCASDTVQVTVGTSTKKIILSGSVTHPYDNCKTPDGELQVSIVGGDPVANYTFAWYSGSNILGIQLGVGDKLSNLPNGTYTALATDKVTGCLGDTTFTIPDITKPVVSATVTNILCSAAANTGEASASVSGDTTNFTFNWYKGTFTKPSPDATKALYTNLIAGKYTVVATNNSSFCKSDSVTVAVTQTSPPIFTTTTSDQTSCDISKPNGSASATVSSGNPATFAWFKGQNTLHADSIASTSTVTGLTPGIYTVRVTDNVTKCFDTKEVTINFAVIPVTLALASQTNSSQCSPVNGSITIQVNPDTPADYTFFWYNGASIKANPDYDTLTTHETLNKLAPGSYTVKAINNLRHCTTNSLTIIIKDISSSITFSETGHISPSDCNSNTGLLQITLSAPSNTLGFNVKWFKGNKPFAAPPFKNENVLSVTTDSTLAAGTYTLEVKDLNTDCIADKSFPLPYSKSPNLKFVSKDSAISCSPANEGSITVSLTPAPTFSNSDYTIFVYTGQNDPVFVGLPDTHITTIPGASIPIQYGPSATPPVLGYYTFVAVPTLPDGSIIPGGCRSNQVTTEVKKVTQNPKFTATLSNNTNCGGNGSISLKNFTPPTTASDYSFSWHRGTDISGTALGGAQITGINGEVAQNLTGGFYTVQVTKITLGANSGCDTTATFQIFDNPPIIDADYTLNNITTCTPLIPTNGSSITINAVRENLVPVPGFAGYTFAWVNSKNVSFGASNAISNVPADTYFVTITSLAGCPDVKIQFKILDKTINTVGVDLIHFIDPTRCLAPTNKPGELEVNGTGTGASFTYNWFTGTTTTTPVAGAPGPDFTNITIPAGQPDITFTVQVVNNTNGCSITDTYKLPLDIVPVDLIASAAPVTSCVNKDGAVFSTVKLSPPSYNYQWYLGDVVKSSPDHTVNFWDNLGTGDYTVFATDLSDNFCQSKPVTVTIQADTLDPVVTTVSTSPVINCNPSNPDGIASASVGGDIFNYTFNWYNGLLTSGPPLYDSTFQASNLDNKTYTVVATNNVTGCKGSASITIISKPKTIPPPQVTVLSDLTSCDPNNPNGSLMVTVTNENPIEYDFTWTEITDPGFAPRSGEIIDKLGIGTYKVVAKELASGCTGEATGKIRSNQKRPKLDLTVVNPSCKVYEAGATTGQADGALAVFVTNGAEIKSVEWTKPGNNTVIGTGPILTEVVAGTYKVSITSTLGCENDTTVIVNADIHPFNGISRNHDDKNETFFINCIDEFPNNLVKIYNRAGTLVYEANNYNNDTIVFDGNSNRGVSPMGTNLPDGTYFYIIDKRDGSKPLAGYLEIVN